MPLNTEKEVKDFIIAYAIKSVRENSRCDVKRNRKDEDFVDYAKWVQPKNMREMIVEYFESDKEHYSEIVKKIQKLKDDIAKTEAAME